MAHQLVRPLRQWPRLHLHCYSCATFNHLHTSSLIAINTNTQCLPFITLPYSHRTVHFRSRGLKLPNAPLPSDLQESDSDSDSDSKKSRNEKKREARRAVHWAMDLASFPNSQIKLILRVTSLEQEVYDGLMLVKRLGPDVKEGKRRQYNYIGKLLRKAQPELMDALIQASKDGDHDTLRTLSGSGTRNSADDDEEREEIEYEEDVEDSHIEIATRWFDGLINKDIEITNEIYSVHSIDFDRQELRRLVRKVHSIQERQDIEENRDEVDTALLGAKKSLTRFLRSLAKRMPSE